MATINQKINLINKIEEQLLLHDDTFSIEKLSQLRTLLLDEHYSQPISDSATNLKAFTAGGVKGHATNYTG